MERESEPSECIVVVGPHRSAQPLEREGWPVRVIDAPSDLVSLQKGDTPRLIVVTARGSTAKTGELIGKLRTAAPLVDVLVLRTDASGGFVRAALRAGANDVVLEDDPKLLVEAARAALDQQRLLPQVEELSQTRHQSGRFEGMLSRSDRMWEIFATIARTAPSDATVLVTGETGTGKDLLARAIHRRSGREGRFVAVNCSSIRPEIVESELFGHERGAFTSAHQAKQGLFRHADGGTLLLDEIGDMPGEAQLSLLRVLQEERIRPVGSTREVPVNVRVVAATNAPLSEQVQRGTFREDLFYRLDVIRLEVPPLRDRPEDVLYLFGHFLRSLCKRYGVNRPHLNQNFIDRLTAYAWPGNVRQLENTVERLVLEGDRETFTLRDLNRVLPRDETTPVPTRTPASATTEVDAKLTLAENLAPATSSIERMYLEALLADTHGRIIEAARRAGISRRTLLRKLGRHGIDKKRYRASSD